MKLTSIVTVLFFLFGLNVGYSQDTLSMEDLAKQLGIGNGKNGQTEISDTGSKSDENIDPNISKVKNYDSTLSSLITKSIKSTLYLIRQNYVALDNKREEWKRKNEKFFSYQYGLGVACGNKIWTSNNLKEPWKNDTYFEANKENFKLTGGKLDRMTYRKASEQVGMKLAKSYSCEKQDEGVMTYCNQGITKESLDGIVGKGIKKGYLLLGYIDHSADPQKAKINTAVIPITLDWEKDKGKLQVPEIDGNVLGGFFIVEEIQTGSISFKLAGIYNANKKEAFITPLLKAVDNKIAIQDSTLEKKVPELEIVNDKEEEEEDCDKIRSRKERRKCKSEKKNK